MEYTFSYFDLWPYVLIANIFIFCYFNRLRASSSIVFIFLFLFCALRFDVGWDYSKYVSELIYGYSSNSVDERYELLSKVIFYISVLLKFYPFVFITFSLLTLLLVYDSINRYSTNRIISWLVYYSMPLFFFASLSTIRQSLATAIVFYSFKFAKDKKYLFFLITIIIASFVHISALVGFFILPFTLYPVNRYISVILLALSFFISTQISNIFSSISSGLLIVSKVQQYMNIETNGSSSLQYLYYFIAILNLFFYKKLIQIDPLNRIYISITMFGIVFFNILSFEPVSATRISAFYLMFWIYLIPSYASIFSFKYKNIVEVFLLFALIVLSFYYLYIYIQAYEAKIIEKISFLPYKIWWNNL